MAKIITPRWSLHYTSTTLKLFGWYPRNNYTNRLPWQLNLMTLPRLKLNPACTNEILIPLRFQICAFCPSFVIPLLSDIIDFRQISHLRPIFSLWSVLQSTTKTSKRALSIHLRCRGKRDRLVGRPREREERGNLVSCVFCCSDGIYDFAMSGGMFERERKEELYDWKMPENKVNVCDGRAGFLRQLQGLEFLV